MAKRAKRSEEFYKLALKGVLTPGGDVLSHGLRQAARGFSSSDGYNLRDVKSWSPAMKAKVTRYFHELQLSTAQPRYLYKPKNKSEREKLANTFPGDPGFNWKVAFIPVTPEKLKSGKQSKAKPRLTFTKDGVKVRQRKYNKNYIPLRPSGLVKSARAEITRAIKANAPDSKHFTVATKAGESINEMPGLDDREFVIKRVVNLMNAYDGKKALPKGSGNRGDAPKHHKWNRWLSGLVGYEFDRATPSEIARAKNEFNDAKLALQKKRRNQRKKQQRQPAKKK